MRDAHEGGRLAAPRRVARGVACNTCCNATLQHMASRAPADGGASPGALRRIEPSRRPGQVTPRPENSRVSPMVPWSTDGGDPTSRPGQTPSIIGRGRERALASPLPTIVPHGHPASGHGPARPGPRTGARPSPQRRDSHAHRRPGTAPGPPRRAASARGVAGRPGRACELVAGGPAPPHAGAGRRAAQPHRALRPRALSDRPGPGDEGREVLDDPRWAGSSVGC